MPDFVYDNTALDHPKTDLIPLAATDDPTKHVKASDWNTVCEALDDVKGVLRGALWFGLTPNASNPAPAGIADYVWLDNANTLWLTSGTGGGGDIDLTAAGGGGGGTDLTGLGVDNRVMRWNGTDTAQSSGVTLDDSNNFSGINNISLGGTVDGRDVAADGAKLDLIEALADVTDATNVAAAGALMANGSANLTGNLSVAVGITIDGRDISVDGAALDALATAILDGDFSGTTSGVLRRVSAGTYMALRDNLGASTVPGTGNDDTQLYGVGSLWINVAADNVYQCVDASTGAAVWKQLDAAGGSGTDLTGLGVDDRVMRWNGTDTAQSSGVTLDDSNNFSGINNISLGGTVDGRDVAADGAKLDLIEALADVTDATNVAAAGALMADGSVGLTGALVSAGASAHFDLNGLARVILDADADTYIDSVSDDTARHFAGGAQIFQVNASGMLLVSGDFTPNGTSDIGSVAKPFRRTFLSEYIDQTEMAAPSGATNKARTYAEVDGVGQTRLMTIFQSGLAQELAREGGPSRVWGNILTTDDAAALLTDPTFRTVSGTGKTLTMPSVGANDDGRMIIVANVDASDGHTITGADSDNVGPSGSISVPAGSAVILLYSHANTTWVPLGGGYTLS